MSGAFRTLWLTVRYCIAVVALWLLAKGLWDVPDYLLPDPRDVFHAMLEQQTDALFHFLTTLSGAAAGFVFGNAIGFVAALIFQLSPGARHALLPLAIALKATPIVALAPLILIWFGTGFASKTVSSSIVAFFPMLIGLYSAMETTPRALLEYVESLRASRLQTLLHVRLPHAVPEAIAALRISSTLAVVGAVVAELMAPSAGLGYLIITSSYQLDTATTFAAVLLTAVAGLLLYSAVGLFEYLLPMQRWRA